jgi:SAM-dependent methyltransferase
VERANRVAARSQPQPSFSKFIGIDEGTVLDVGCGPGKFRFQLDPSKVRYVGLDPIALPGVGEFPFVQGLAEYLPFKDRTFTDIVVLAALDHFRDLDRFLSEARRVLVETGRLHIMQSIHEVKGPVSAVKVVVHKVKDALEEGLSTRHGREVPKHLTEFTSGSLVERVGRAFDVVSTETYSATWYSPDKRFLSFVPRAERVPGSRERHELTA